MSAAEGRGRVGRALRALATGRLPRGRARARRGPGDAELARDSAKPLARLLADQLFSRVAGAERTAGNRLRLLQDGAENYPAWLEAIGGAAHSVDFENYIIKDDAVGRRFAAALAERAGAGVRVRLLYDWMGCLTTGWGLWRRLRAAGVEVRCFNRPRLDSPFGWLSRNHRKTLTVDGQVGFVSGLCVAQVWEGTAKTPPWRDTGVEIRGPAVADMVAAFGQSWRYAGGSGAGTGAAAEPEGRRREDGGADGAVGADAGGVALRVIGSKPNTMGIYRLDQLIAGLARERLWLTDAYFVGTTAYVRTLIDAAADGVDVRLLVPGSSDLAVAKALSRAGYRPLLEAGIRVYEWNGPMLHAKTAVADGRWARIGSSNLNIASWMGNWELDVAVEDGGFAGAMERMFEADLENATEIVLEQSGVHSKGERPQRPGKRGSPGRLAAGAVGLGSTVTAAITNHRSLGPAELRVMAAGGVLLLALAVVGIAWPMVLTVPVALLAAWIATTLLIRAGRLSLAGRQVSGERRGGDA